MRLNKDLIMQPNTVVRAETQDERDILCEFASNNNLWTHYKTNWYTFRYEELKGNRDFCFYEGYVLHTSYSDGHNYTILTLDDVKLKEDETKDLMGKKGIIFDESPKYMIVRVVKVIEKTDCYTTATGCYDVIADGFGDVQEARDSVETYKIKGEKYVIVAYFEH